MFDALKASYAAHPKLQAERARQRAEESRLIEATGAFLPSVAGSFDQGYDTRKNRIGNSKSQAQYGRAGVSVTQPLFDGMRNVNELKRVKNEVLAGYEDLFSQEQRTLLKAAETYMAVVRDNRLVRLREDNLKALRAQIAHVQGRQTEGDVSKTAVEQVRTRLGEAEVDLAQSRQDQAESLAAFQAMVSYSAITPVMPPLPIFDLPHSMADALAVAERDNPELRSAVYQSRAAAKNVEVAAGAFMPKVALEARYDHGMGTDLNALEADESSVRLKINVPIFNSTRDFAALSHAKETRAQRKFEVDDTRLTLSRIIGSIWAQLQGARARKSAAQKQIASAQGAINGLNAEFEAGQISIVDILDGRRELVRSQISLAVAEHDEVVAIFALVATMGRLSIKSVDAVAALRPATAVAAAKSSSQPSEKFYRPAPPAVRRAAEGQLVPMAAPPLFGAPAPELQESFLRGTKS